MFWFQPKAGPNASLSFGHPTGAFGASDVFRKDNDLWSWTTDLRGIKTLFWKGEEKLEIGDEEVQ